MRSHELPRPIQYELSSAQVGGNFSIVNIALVVGAAFMVGLIPVAYLAVSGSNLTATSPTQAGIWESLGQRD
jgi:cation transporter-like permease